MSGLSDDELLEALGVDQEKPKLNTHSPREQRLIAGFEEIQRFVKTHGRSPQHGEQNDIFERIYAMRLERLRQEKEFKTLLQPLDYQGLLKEHEEPSDVVSTMEDDELLSELEGDGATTDITELRHVRPQTERRLADEIARREPCEDFEQFKPLFDQVDLDLKTGVRYTRPFGQDASVDEGDFFILGGQLVYVAAKGRQFTHPNGHVDARLRVIYSNRTESNLLLRSLQRALYKDETSRRVIKPTTRSLFSETWDEDDIESGTIYVLRSRSEHPFIAEHRELIHKIGVTGGKVEARVANAANDPTYLLADVEIVATYKLSGINRGKLEGILHKIFSPAQLNLTIHDRFGRPVRPKEWFLAPLHVIDEAVQRIRDGSITRVMYDPKLARLIPLS